MGWTRISTFHFQIPSGSVLNMTQSLPNEFSTNFIQIRYKISKSLVSEIKVRWMWFSAWKSEIAGENLSETPTNPTDEESC